MYVVCGGIEGNGLDVSVQRVFEGVCVNLL